jgi:hypothetical protein
VLLQQYCEVAVGQDRLFDRLRAVTAAGELESAAAEALERRLATGVKALTVLATKLRLSVQTRLRYDAGRLDEKGPPAHRLLGGNVAPFMGRKR